eukprot:470543_1
MKFSSLLCILLLTFPTFNRSTFPVDDILNGLGSYVVDPLKSYIDEQVPHSNDIWSDIAGDGGETEEVPIPCGGFVNTGCTMTVRKKYTLTTITDALTQISDDITTAVSDISGDITDLASDVSGDITGLASDISGDITGLASDISNDMTQLGSHVSGHMTSLASNLAGDISENHGQLNTIINGKIPLLDGKLIDLISDVDKIIELIQNPLSALSQDEDIKSLANTLNLCISDLFDAVFFGIPNPMEKLFDIDVGIDFESLIYQLLAIPLLPFKDQIDFICIDGLDMMLSAINVVKNIPLSTSGTGRRLMDDIKEHAEAERRRTLDIDETECVKDEWGLCDPADVPYNTWKVSGDPTKGYNDMAKIAGNVISSLLVGAGCFEANSVENIYEKPCFATTRLLWQLLEWILRLVYDELIDKCMTGRSCAIGPVKCQGQVYCSEMYSPLEYVLTGIDWIRWAIDFHNGQIENAESSAESDNIVYIIHNQHALRQLINDKYKSLRILITGGTLAATTNVENIKADIEFAEKTQIKSVLAKLDQIHEDVITGNNIATTRHPTPSPTWNPTVTQYASKKVKYNDINTGNSKGTESKLITITLELRDLYTFIAISIGCCLLFMFIGIMIGKCIFQSKVNNGFSAVPKYDYSTSDVEDASK